MRQLLAALTLAIALCVGAAIAQVSQWPPQQGSTAILCAYNTVEPTLRNGQVGLIQCDSAGNITIQWVEQ